MEGNENGLIIVEDEPLIAMLIQEIALDLGWQVVGVAHSEADAFAMLATCCPQVALLDINLGLQTSLGVAAYCRDRGIAVVFITGYTARDVPEPCGNAPILSKPFSPDELAKALKRGLSEVASSGKNQLCILPPLRSSVEAMT